MKETVSRSSLPRDDWGRFLEEYGRRHQGWFVRFETHDLVTRERVESTEMELESMELDLEDEKNPRINITVRSGNTEIKHILFLPSQLTVHLPDGEAEQSLEVETINTETTVRLRAPIH